MLVLPLATFIIMDIMFKTAVGLPRRIMKLVLVITAEVMMVVAAEAGAALTALVRLLESAN
jgi:hypothetical protein